MGKKKYSKEADKTPSLYKFMKLKYLKEVLETGKGLYASDPTTFNDPFEYLPYSQDDCKNFRVICLTKSNGAKLMWSHYACGHKGCMIKILLEPKNYFTDPNCVFKDVKYTSQRDYNSTQKILKEILYQKDKKFEHENEVRAVFDLRENNDGIVSHCSHSDGEKSSDANDAKYYFTKFAIDKIILGCASHLDEDYKEALKWIYEYKQKYPNLKIEKRKLSEKKFQVVNDMEFDFDKLVKSKVQQINQKQ